MKRETANREYKREVSDTFLKTVSALANYQGGDIIFGVADDGSVVGLEDPVADALVIEQKINDTIVPLPHYTLDVNEDSTITLHVERSPFPPYTYRSKAYMRRDSSTVAVDRLEYNRLLLRGMNYSFEELDSENQDLDFSVLSEALRDQVGVQDLNGDVIKTLQLADTRGIFNNAAALLADSNDFPGINILRFGANISEIYSRHDLSGSSVIEQLKEATNLYREHYQHESISGALRTRVESIPEVAFREAVANALAHRQWDLPAAINVGMHPDRIEVTSPGGLPEGVTEEEYLHGRLSVPRNPILATVFFRLGYIEKFGTGIARINFAYRNSIAQPRFEIHGQSVTVILPVMSTSSLTQNEADVLRVLESGSASRAQIERDTGLSRAQTLAAINELIEMGAVERLGDGPATTYRARNNQPPR